MQPQQLQQGAGLGFEASVPPYSGRRRGGKRRGGHKRHSKRRSRSSSRSSASRWCFALLLHSCKCTSCSLMPNAQAEIDCSNTPGRCTEKLISASSDASSRLSVGVESQCTRIAEQLDEVMIVSYLLDLTPGSASCCLTNKMLVLLAMSSCLLTSPGPTRSRSRSQSPAYRCHVPKFPVSAIEGGVSFLLKSFKALYIPSDFCHLVASWSQSLRGGHAVNLTHHVAMRISQVRIHSCSSQCSDMWLCCECCAFQGMCVRNIGRRQPQRWHPSLTTTKEACPSSKCIGKGVCLCKQALSGSHTR